MGITAVKIKIMPESAETDMEELQGIIRKEIEDKEGKNVSFEIHPIAFGLKALVALFALDESNELETIENAINNLSSVGSTQVVDMRRAFG